jgi:hypothetical protein
METFKSGICIADLPEYDFEGLVANYVWEGRNEIILETLDLL